MRQSTKANTFFQRNEKQKKHAFRRSATPFYLSLSKHRISGHWHKITRGGSRFFNFNEGVADTNRPPNYTLIYFKLSYFCPKTWRFRKDELETVTLQTLETYFYTFWDPRISVCFSTCYIYIFFCLVGCSKGGWLATQSTPAPLSWIRP